MRINIEGINLIKDFEQCVLTAYKDAIGIPTIGYGMTFYPNGKRVRLGDQISKEQADQMFDYVLAKFAREVQSLVKQPLNDNQFSALVSFAYNVGTDIDIDTIPEGLGDSTLLKKVNTNPNDPTIRNEFMKWVKAGGKTLNGLIRRRKAEADLYFKK